MIMRNDRNSQIRLIDSTFNRLSYCCDSTRHWEDYIELHQAEENGHRKFKPDHVQCGLTKGQAVRYFAVKTVFERMVPAHAGESIFTPEAKDYFSIRRSVFAAAAIADLCRVEIEKEFSPEAMSQFLASVDYCELNKDPHAIAA
jgi:hypothetical protein